MDLKISDLKNFIDTANHSTLSYATKVLKITQPSLSQSIKNLEKDLNIKLFYRTKKGISLTPDGKELLEKSMKIFEQIDSLFNIHKQEFNEISHKINIGCHPILASIIFPKALPIIYEKMPHIKINFQHNTSVVVQKQLQNAEVDIGIVANVAQLSDFILRKLGEDIISVWASEKKAKRDYIACSENSLHTQYILNSWKNKPINILNSESLEFAARIANTGVAYAILPENVVKLYNLPLVKQTHLPTLNDLIFIVHRPEFGKKKYEKFILDTITKVYKDFTK